MDDEHKLRVLSDLYPLEDLLEQNDIECYTVVKFLWLEGLFDLDDYFMEDEVIEE